MTKVSELYDRDFVLWTEEQAAALRRSAGSNLPLDWENLAEEIESLGRSDRRQLTSQIRRIIHHLLKLDVSRAVDPQAGWRTTIIEARSDIEEVLRDSPSLRRELGRIVAEQLPLAARLASTDLARHGEPINAIRTRVQNRGFTAEQVLGDWFPDTSD